MTSKTLEKTEYDQWLDIYQNTRKYLIEKSEQLVPDLDQIDNEIDMISKKINIQTSEKNDIVERKQ